MQRTAGSHYCCTAQDSLNGDQLTAQFEVNLEESAEGKGPKIKKRESMVFDHTLPTPPLTLTMVFLFRIFNQIFSH